jgi:site-specific DNA-adenine methylase
MGKCYGMPYKGSKNKIAEWIISQLPEGECFVDLFGGGGAITHCALLSEKWNKVIYNELNSTIADGFKKAVQGKFKNEKRWISREDFQRLKDTDPYVSMCFSFGSGCKSYCYSSEIEQMKKHIHKFLLSDTVEERYDGWLNFVRDFIKQSESLESLERLKRLQSMERLKIFNKSYEDVEIPKNAVVYCDIPYKGTSSYKDGFNHEKFYEWALNQPFKIYISEYEMPLDFKLIASKEKTSSFGASNSKRTVEKIFCNR